MDYLQLIQRTERAHRLDVAAFAETKEPQIDKRTKWFKNINTWTVLELKILK